MDNQEIEQKVIRVIESCKTVDHIDAATKYVLLFFKRTGNVSLFRELINRLNEQSSQLN